LGRRMGRSELRHLRLGRRMSRSELRHLRLGRRTGRSELRHLRLGRRTLYTCIYIKVQYSKITRIPL